VVAHELFLAERLYHQYCCIVQNHVKLRSGWCIVSYNKGRPLSPGPRPLIQKASELGQAAFLNSSIYGPSPSMSVSLTCLWWWGGGWRREEQLQMNSITCHSNKTYSHLTTPIYYQPDRLKYGCLVTDKCILLWIIQIHKIGAKGWDR
jgi:hypothetical protein